MAVASENANVRYSAVRSQLSTSWNALTGMTAAHLQRGGDMTVGQIMDELHAIQVATNAFSNKIRLNLEVLQAAHDEATGAGT